jgi:beta-xylosidase
MDYTLILHHNYPDAEWSLNNNDYEQLNWLSDLPKPTKEELDNLWESTLAKIESEKLEKLEAKSALLERLGITEEEAKLLLS